jgi:acyl transferase domain-containing protein/NAD(P)H-dependent flavin oxidoreductase YrpB (nitropropane dioxygenase family)/NAD(P)-dependent dehydrogenase (short-subunit alcohol dehydrogenase family)
VSDRPSFELMILTPSGPPDPSLAIAGSRAGALGVLNLEFAHDIDAAMTALEVFAEHGRGRRGVLLDGEDGGALLRSVLASRLEPELVILTAGAPDRSGLLVGLVHERGLRAGLVVTSLEEAQAGRDAGIDFVIAKGHESGGWVGEETAFVLLQRLVRYLDLPVWVQGGVGLHTAAGCYAAGAAGAVLDSQLLLTRESPLADEVRARLSVADGSETACLGASFGLAFRAYTRPGLPVVDGLRRLETETALAESSREARSAWRSAVRQRVGWGRPEENLLAVGQDVAFAPGLARRYRTVGGIVAAVRQSILEHCLAATASRPLAEGSALARSHGTRYPIVQGPMTRVSDRAEFAAEVAEAGALPFLALALMRAQEIRGLLEETRRQLGDRPWGVGILGFVPPELRAEQLEVVRAYRPPFALIAGGRPDQARVLENDGIPAYLHVPSPGLLRMFLQDGARRFVFEGRECGGHVGPRTSFVLWESAINALEEHIANGAKAADYHVLFAGGIHDGLSAAMIAAMAAPVASRGVHVGVLIGTAYLFTEEAVRSGAILPGFQRAAVGCDRTALLESGPGHATRCAPSPFVEAFGEEKRRLVRSGLPAEELRYRLEELNIGRLRIASKGQDRHPQFGRAPDAPKLIDLDEQEQWSRGMYMIGQVAALRDGTCTIAELHREVSEGATRRVEGIAPPPVADEPAPAAAAVAVVGMGCILPGAADLRSLWANICNKVDAITEVPASRWDASLYFDPDRAARDKVYSRWGGFVDDVAFDPTEFGMPPSSLRSIEPFQLLALAVVRAAIQDAGYQDRPFPRGRTSVILGAGGGGADLTSGYMVRSTLPHLLGGEAAGVIDGLGDRLPEWTEDSFAGILMNVASGRVANRFDLGGVNYTVDAACASSLAAVYLAVRDLEARTSDVAVVGGVDALQNPFPFLCFSKTQALSPNGRCRSFDAEGDGIAISEGYAAVILKRLEDAERDGDRIYAVIRGVGGASDGRDRSLTAPRPEGQIRALRRAYAQAGFSPASVALIEAHGTGTVAGDQAEVQALTAFFNEAQADRQSCAIGSVKSMIGHTKATAGVAGLIKAALALHHRVLPPTLGVTRPNPKSNFPESPFYVNTETRPWVHATDAHPRRAGVSAFGFGGTNFHVVAEEYTGDHRRDEVAALDPWPAELLVFHGRSRQEVLAAVVGLLGAIERGAKPRTADLAHTLALKAGSAEQGSPVLAVVATGLVDLTEKLRAARALLESPADQGHDPRGVHYAEKPPVGEGRIAFLFPGQGSQYVNMGRDVALGFAEARATFERAERVLADRLARPLGRFIFPPPAFSAEEKKRQQGELTETQVAQPALGATDMALFHALRALGVEPGMVAGHSYGEFAALCAAGCFGEEDLFRLSEARGRFMRECASLGDGAMAAAEASPEVLRPLLTDDPGLTLANLNAPTQTVISGTRAGIDQVLKWCQAREIEARILPVSCAFHSPLVAPAQHRLAEVLRGVAIRPPRVPVFSNTTAALYPETPSAMADLLSEHLARPVQFVGEVEAMYQAGARVFVEVGPRSVLCGLVGRTLHDRPHVCIPMDQPSRNGLEQFLHGLARLVTEGVRLRLERLYQGREVRRLDLSALEKETEQAKHSPTTWLVNGGKARPVSQTAKPAQAPRPLAPSRGGDGAPASGMSPTEAGPAPKTSPKAAGSGRSVGGPRPVNPTPPQVPIIKPLPLPEGGGRDPDTPASPSHPRLQPIRPWAGSGGNGMSPAAKPPTRFEIIPRRDRPSNDRGEIITMHNGSQTLMHDGYPGLLPATTGEHAADMLRQFQHVMQCFLHTQEVVMRDLTTAFLGVQSGRTPGMNHATNPRPIGSVNGRPHSGPDDYLSREMMPAPHAPGGRTNGVSARSAPAQKPTHRIDPANGSAHSGTSENGLNGRNTGDLATPTEVPARVVSHAQQGAATEHAREEDGLGSPLPQHTAAETIDVQRVTEALLAIVSERTGYPTDMLSLDADLEADLGIDSIKRVEIAGTIVRSLELPPDRSPDLERLTASRTLRQVIENLESMITPSELLAATAANGAEGHHVPFEEARAGSGIGRFALRAVLAPPVGQPGGLSRAGAVVIVDDETGVGERIAGRLIGRGYRVVRVVPGADALSSDEGILAAELSQPDGVSRFVERFHERCGPAAALIHLAALRPGAGEIGLDAARWRARLAADLTSLFLLAQAFRPDLERAAGAGGAAVLAATGLGGTFAVGDTPASFFPGHGAVIGLLKSLAQEWPTVRVKGVDVSPAAPGQVAEWLLAELLADDGLVEVGYQDGRRSRLELVPATPGPTADSPPLDRHAVVLVTGGARGITAAAAQMLADAYRPTLVLVGRTPPPAGPEPSETAGMSEPQALKRALIERHSRGAAVTPAMIEESFRRLMNEREVRESLARLERSGARVAYRPCDVRDPDAFGTLIDEVYSTYGRIDGVIHGAGVIEDKLVRDKRLDSFERVVSTKVESALALAAKLRPEALRFLVFFSSVSGRFGNRGQGDYAAASEVLNKLAQDLDRRWPGRVVSINWGPWLTTGMVTPEVQRQFAERGVELIPPDLGCLMLDEELRSGRNGEAEVVIGGARGLGGLFESPVNRPTTRSRPAKHHASVALGLPLLGDDCPVIRQADGRIEVARTLDLDRDLYLRDHRLDGHPILPFAVALELMAEVASAGWPDLQVVGLRDARLLRGVTLDGDQAPLRVVARPQDGPRDETLLVDLTIASGKNPGQAHYRAVVELGRSLEPAEVSETEGLSEGAGPLSRSVDDVYREWLFHGPIFQGIASIEAIGPNGAQATLRPSAVGDCLNGVPTGDWLFDPVVVDSALQMQVVWARLHWDVTLLPSAGRVFRRSGPLKGGPRGIRYELRVRPETRAPLSYADHLFYGPDGSLLAVIKSMEGTGSKALNRLAGGPPAPRPVHTTRAPDGGSDE